MALFVISDLTKNFPAKTSTVIKGSKIYCKLCQKFYKQNIAFTTVIRTTFENIWAILEQH
jgi:hypothetical protein